MNNKLVAIHQPNLLPWLGYFDKINRSDIFIFLDNVQFPKKGGSWTNRVRIIINKEEGWITFPVNRAYHGVKIIKDIEIKDNSVIKEKLLRTIEINYSKAPFFNEVFQLLLEIFDFKASYISEFNINAVSKIANKLYIKIEKMQNGSELNVTGKATDLLISIVKAAGGSAYLAGGGAQGYQEDDKYLKNKIELIYQNYQHPIYDQYNKKTNFIPGLSIIDSLMNCGFSGVRKLLHIE